MGNSSLMMEKAFVVEVEREKKEKVESLGEEWSRR